MTYRAKCDGRRLQRRIRRLKRFRTKIYSWSSIKVFVDGVEMKEVESISYSEPKPAQATPPRALSGFDYTTTFKMKYLPPR